MSGWKWQELILVITSICECLRTTGKPSAEAIKSCMSGVVWRPNTGVSERTVYSVVKRLGSDCKTVSVGSNGKTL